MRALAIAAVACLASAGAEAACMPHDSACSGASRFAFGSDRFAPRERAGSDLYINRRAPPSAESPASRFRFDSYGRMILAPARRRPVQETDLDPADDAADGENELQAVTRPNVRKGPQGIANAPQGPADAPQGPADAPQGFADAPQGPADVPQQANNGY